jgi:hypothetical protein
MKGKLNPSSPEIGWNSGNVIGGFKLLEVLIGDDCVGGRVIDGAEV